MVLIGKMAKQEKGELRVVIAKRLIKQVQIVCSLTDKSQSELITELINECLSQRYPELWKQHRIDLVNGDD
jgi:hypothetical protein